MPVGNSTGHFGQDPNILERMCENIRHYYNPLPETLDPRAPETFYYTGVLGCLYTVLYRLYNLLRWVMPTSFVSIMVTIGEYTFGKHPRGDKSDNSAPSAKRQRNDYNGRRTQRNAAGKSKSDLRNTNNNHQDNTADDGDETDNSDKDEASDKNVAIEGPTDPPGFTLMCCIAFEYGRDFDTFDECASANLRTEAAYERHMQRNHYVECGSNCTSPGRKHKECCVPPAQKGTCGQRLATESSQDKFHPWKFRTAKDSHPNEHNCEWHKAQETPSRPDGAFTCEEDVEIQNKWFKGNSTKRFKEFVASMPAVKGIPKKKLDDLGTILIEGNDEKLQDFNKEFNLSMSDSEELVSKWYSTHDVWLRSHEAFCPERPRVSYCDIPFVARYQLLSHPDIFCRTKWESETGRFPNVMGPRGHRRHKETQPLYARKVCDEMTECSGSENREGIRCSLAGHDTRKDPYLPYSGYEIRYDFSGEDDKIDGIIWREYIPDDIQRSVRDRLLDKIPESLTTEAFRDQLVISDDPPDTQFQGISHASGNTTLGTAKGTSLESGTINGMLRATAQPVPKPSEPALLLPSLTSGTTANTSDISELVDPQLEADAKSREAQTDSTAGVTPRGSDLAGSGSRNLPDGSRIEEISESIKNDVAEHKEKYHGKGKIDRRATN